jgi:uncharacterized membrane protein HdeD (DUF308 family)
MMRREFIWTDSLVMGIILIVAGLFVCVGAFGSQISFLGGLILGVVLAVAGVVLVRQGLKLRPHERLHD